MLNTSYDEKFGKKGLTFDDVLLIPGESDVEPRMLMCQLILPRPSSLTLRL